MIASPEASPEKRTNTDSRRDQFLLPPRLQKADEKKRVTRKHALSWGTRMELQLKEEREQKIQQNKVLNSAYSCSASHYNSRIECILISLKEDRTRTYS